MSVTLGVPQLPAPRDGNLCRRIFDFFKRTLCHVGNGLGVLPKGPVTEIS